MPPNALQEQVFLSKSQNTLEGHAGFFLTFFHKAKTSQSCSVLSTGSVTLGKFLDYFVCHLLSGTSHGVHLMGWMR